jgi:hypothetical protein
LGWNVFFHPNVHTIGAACVLLQQVGRAGNEVLRWQGRGQVFAADAGAGTFFKMKADCNKW